MTRALAAATALFAASCGTKTDLGVPEPSAPPPPAMDAATPAPIDDSGNDDVVRSVRFDECFEVDRDERRGTMSLAFDTRITTADVLFLVDTTGSMGTEIATIQHSLRDVLIPGIAAAIPSVQFAVASYADFPTEPYGAAEDLPFFLHQESTNEVYWVERAVDELPASNGNDEPESLVEALYLAATGEGLPGLVADGPRCPDRVGYPCFRATGARVFLVFTDAPSHNGPAGTNAYRDLRDEPHTYRQAIEALAELGAKVIGLNSGDVDDGEHLRQIVADTGAVDSSGEPLVRNIGFSGESLDRDVVETVTALVEDVPLDVELLLEDVGGDDLDATTLVGGLSIESVTPPDATAGIEGARALDVRPGSRVTFRMDIDATHLPRSDADTAYHVRAVLVGDRTTPLEERMVRIVVPGRRRSIVCD